MAGLARLAKQLGHSVTGSEKKKIYPPMSTQIEKLGIPVNYGYMENSIPENTDLVIIGNSLSRGQPIIEKILDEKINFNSGPAWLNQEVLKDRKRIVVSGTHGKTTVASLIAWILEENGFHPGFLIGGVPGNFPLSAELGDGKFFVIEGDEYDSAFFDKRSKFAHYDPDILIINNLEFDHADIFSNLAQITDQFHYMVRAMPSNAHIIRPHRSNSIDRLINKGCWSSVRTFGPKSGADLQYSYNKTSSHSIGFSRGKKRFAGTQIGLGEHNAENQAAAILACECAGLPIEVSLESVKSFRNAKRRMEQKGIIGGVSIYDDFAHHPTAIRASVNALKRLVGMENQLFAIIEPISNSMRMGLHKNKLNSATKSADKVGIYCNNQLQWRPEDYFDEKKFIGCWDSASKMAKFLVANCSEGDYVLIMSNGSSGGLHDLLLEELKGKVK